MVDKTYAMSSFLQFRNVYGSNVKFAEGLDYPLKSIVEDVPKILIQTADELCVYLEKYVADATKDGKAALALSGGIDSAILAKFMPRGSTAYTFECVAEGKQVKNETERAKRYCDENGLIHKIIYVSWQDYLEIAPMLMKRKNAPIHSIEVQIHKAALQASEDGFERIIFGDSSDMVFGGLDGLISQDWTIGEFIDRFSCVLPYKILKDFTVITEPFVKHTVNGMTDAHAFINDIFSIESHDSYVNACESAGIESLDAYLALEHNPIDLKRIRSGDTKYVVREAFRKLYPEFELPEKIPMLRAVDEWLEEWEGPKRSEFIENCHIRLSGNQKFYVWILERFLDEMGI